MTPIFDTHAHYDDERFNNDREEVFALLKENSITKVVNIGADIPSSKNAIELSNKYDFIYASVGVHPHEAESMTDSDIAKLEEMFGKDAKIGVFVGIELKRDGHLNGVSDAQKIVGNQIKKANGLWFAIDDAEVIEALMVRFTEE